MTRQASPHPPAVLVAVSLALVELLTSACGRGAPVPQMPVTPQEQEGGPPAGTSMPEPESQAAAGEQPRSGGRGWHAFAHRFCH